MLMLRVVGASSIALVLLMGANLWLEIPFLLNEQLVVFMWALGLFIYFCRVRGSDDVKVFGIFLSAFIALWSIFSSASTVVGYLSLLGFSIIPTLLLLRLISSFVRSRNFILVAPMAALVVSLALYAIFLFGKSQEEQIEIASVRKSNSLFFSRSVALFQYQNEDLEMPIPESAHGDLANSVICSKGLVGVIILFPCTR